MYEPPKPPSFWSEFWLLTRIVYGILFWPFLILVGALLALLGTFILLTIHWGFGLLPIAAVVAVVAAFAWWESHRPHPPPL